MQKKQGKNLENINELENKFVNLCILFDEIKNKEQKLNAYRAIENIILLVIESASSFNQTVQT